MKKKKLFIEVQEMSNLVFLRLYLVLTYFFTIITANIDGSGDDNNNKK